MIINFVLYKRQNISPKELDNILHKLESQSQQIFSLTGLPIYFMYNLFCYIGALFIMPILK